MKNHLRILLLVVCLFAVGATVASASDRDFVVPAVATGEGALSSRWEGQITFHNAGAEAVVATIRHYNSLGFVGSVDKSLDAYATVTIEDILKNEFGLASGAGAIVIDVPDAQASKIVVSGRSINRSPNGEFGSNVPTATPSDAFIAGDIAVLTGPADAAANRFNFGAFAVEDTTIEWILIRADGSEAFRVEETYAAGTFRQHNNGIVTYFARDAADDDVVYGRVKSGEAYFLGSIVNGNILPGTGDPSWVAPRRTRDVAQVLFAGVDTNEDGTIDVPDADHDGQLDRSISVVTGGWPNFFRVVASTTQDRVVTYSKVSGPEDAAVSPNGTVQWSASGSLKGTTAILVVRASDGVDSVDLAITVTYR